MPITPYLDGSSQFDPETKRIMGAAFELGARLWRWIGVITPIQYSPRGSSSLPRRASAILIYPSPGQVCGRRLERSTCQSRWANANAGRGKMPSYGYPAIRKFSPAVLPSVGLFLHGYSCRQLLANTRHCTTNGTTANPITASSVIPTTVSTYSWSAPYSLRQLLANAAIASSRVVA